MFSFFWQSLAMVCDYVEGMEKYEQALEADPDSKMVKELTHKLENLRAAPKVTCEKTGFLREKKSVCTRLYLQ